MGALCSRFIVRSSVTLAIIIVPTAVIVIVLLTRNVPHSFSFSDVSDVQTRFCFLVL